MIKLLHVSTVHGLLDLLNHDWDHLRAFLQKHGFQGVELFTYHGYDNSSIPRELVEGIHLGYKPMWLDLWRGDTAALLRQFGSEEEIINYYGGTDRQALLDYYRREFAVAKTIGAKYMVFHVAHVELMHAYTWQFTYTDEEVMEACAELINEVFGSDDAGIMLLLENLWWPGMRLLDYKATRTFLESIKYPRKGIVLDISHLICTNPVLQNEEEACGYILDSLNALNDLKMEIKAIHLNSTMPGAYLAADHSPEIEMLQQATSYREKIRLVMPHIQRIDAHRPFCSPEIRKVIAAVEPQYLVFELLTTSVEELEEAIVRQNQALYCDRQDE